MSQSTGLGFIAILIVWGGLLYGLFYGSWSFGGSGDASMQLSSVAASFDGISESSIAEGQTSFLAVSENGKNFQPSVIHFNKKINTSDIVVSPSDPDLMYAASNLGLFVSRDGGKNWYSFSDLEKKIDVKTKVYKIFINPPQEIFISVFKDGKGIVYRTLDNLFSLDNVFEIDKEGIYDLAVKENNLYIALSDGRLMLYSLDNNTFEVLKKFESPITHLELANNSRIYLALESGKFLISDDNGRSFRTNDGLRDMLSQGANFDFWSNNRKVKDLWVDPQSNSVYLAAVSKIIYSSDGGGNWEFLKSLPSRKPIISAFASKKDPGIIYIASENKIYVSRDQGAKWEILEPPIGNRTISVLNVENGRIIVGTKR